MRTTSRNVNFDINLDLEGARLLSESDHIKKHGIRKATLIDPKGNILKLEASKQRKKNFGSFGPLINVKKLHTPWAILVVPIDPSEVSDLDLGTSILIYYNNNTNEVQLVEASGFSADDKMIFGRITKAGLYQAMALPKNS